MKKMAQFVFYGENNENNFPQNLNRWLDNLFADYGYVSHLGIQGQPNIIFYLNRDGGPITIGGTGIYELNLEGLGYISSLRFDRQKLLEVYNNHVNPQHRLIVDIVYEGG